MPAEDDGKGGGKGKKITGGRGSSRCGKKVKMAEEEKKDLVPVVKLM